MPEDNKNGNAVVPFVKPGFKKPANDEIPPDPRAFTFKFDTEEEVQTVGLLMFMPPFVGVGQQDGTILFLTNPEHILYIKTDAVPAPKAAA